MNDSRLITTPLWLRIYTVLFIVFGLFLATVGTLRILVSGPSSLIVLDIVVGCIGIAAGALTLAFGESRLVCLTALAGFLISFASQTIAEDGLTLLNAVGIAVWLYALYDMAFVRYSPPRRGCPPPA